MPLYLDHIKKTRLDGKFTALTYLYHSPRALFNFSNIDAFELILQILIRFC